MESATIYRIAEEWETFVIRYLPADGISPSLIFAHRCAQ